MSLGWFSIGATGDITLTNANIDNGTLFVDKDNDRVGIRTTAPANVLQIGVPVGGGVNPLNPLASSGITMMVAKSSIPQIAPGSEDLSGTLWINSTDTYARNKGASIALGGRSNTNQHLTFGRVCGVHNNASDVESGELVMETTSGGHLIERFRIKSDGRVGVGVTNPSGGFHILSDVICAGLWNTGYRRDVADGALIAPGSATKVPHNSYVTALTPSGVQPGWLYRIDGSGLKYIYGSAVDPTTGDSYYVGSFNGTLQFYNPGSSIPTGAQFNSGTGLMAFLVKISESGQISWAARLDAPGVNDFGMGVTVVGTSVFVTGAFSAGATFTAYNQGSTGSAFGTTLTNVGGGNTGFIVKYSSIGSVQGVAKVDGTGDVVLTCVQGYSSTHIYIGGYHNTTSLTASSFSSLTTKTAPATTGSFEAIVCKYTVDLVAEWVSVVRSPGEDLIQYPSRGIDVDSVGNVYAVGYVSGDMSIVSSNGNQANNVLALPIGSTRMGFLVKFSSAGIYDWSAKITSTLTAQARSVCVTPGGQVFVVGDFVGGVSFRDSGDTSVVKSRQQVGAGSPPTNITLGFLAQYTISGTHNWSTKIQSSGISSDTQLNMVGCDNDSFGNCYVCFNSTVTGLTSSTVSVFQRNSPLVGGNVKAASDLSYHRISSPGGVLGVACYNGDGKVLYVTKVDSSRQEVASSLTVYQRTGGDQYPRVIVSGWTFGREVLLTDPVGNVFRYLTGLANQDTTTNTSFIAHFASFSTYVLEYPTVSEITRRFINTSGGRCFIIPYYDFNNNLETAYTRGIFEAPSATSIELSFLNETWIIASNQPSFLTSSEGNVGIGVIQPTNLLEVEGTGSFAGNVGIGTKNASNRLSVYENGGNNVYAAVIEQGNPLANGLLVKNSQTASGQKMFAVGNGSTETFVVLSDGRVGINTNNPGAFNLNVNGTLAVNGTQVTTSQWETVSSGIRYQSNVDIGGYIDLSGQVYWVEKGNSIPGFTTGDQSGFSISLSDDGTVLAVGARKPGGLGYVRVYKYNGTSWAIRGSAINNLVATVDPGDEFGFSISLNSNGTILAVGAPLLGGGIAQFRGRVQVFIYNEPLNSWAKRGNIDVANTETLTGSFNFQYYGTSVGLDNEGDCLVVGAPAFQSVAGTTFTYFWNGSNYVPLATFSNNIAGDLFGSRVSVKGSLNSSLTIASGAPSGNYVNIIERDATLGFGTPITINGEISGESFGSSVHISRDLSSLAVGAPSNSSQRGTVRVYIKSNSSWTKRGTNINGESAGDRFGDSLSMSNDGTILAVGAPLNDGGGSDSGHVRVFRWDNSSWVRRGNTDIDGSTANDNFGTSVSLSGDGTILAVGAPLNDPSSGTDAGLVKVFNVVGARITPNDNGLQLEFDTLKAVTVSPTGKVGIGVTTPDLPLHVVVPGFNNGVKIRGFANNVLASQQMTIDGDNLIGQNSGGFMYFYWRIGGAKYGGTIPAFGQVFTGQHKSFSNTIERRDVGKLKGLIVCSTGKHQTISNHKPPTDLTLERNSINNAHPIIELSSRSYQKSVYGVISNYDDEKPRMNNEGNIVYDEDLEDNGLYDDLLERIRVNSLGEGSIWVTNENGNIENGDFIVTSSLQGYGMRQNDDIFRNYTVAKSTTDCDFVRRKVYKLKIKHETITDNTGAVSCKIEKDKNGTVITEPVKKRDIGVVNENEEDEYVMEDEYSMRYFYDRKEITYEEFTVLSSDENTKGLLIVAAFIPCTYHCG